MTPTTQDYVDVAGNSGQATNFSAQPNAGDALYNSYVSMGVDPANAAAMAQIAVPSFVPPAEASSGGWVNGTYSGPSNQSGIPTTPGGAITGGAAAALGVPDGSASSTPEQYQQILKQQAAPLRPPVAVPAVGVGGAAGAPGVGGTGTAGMNVPYGADFFQPMMQYLLGMLGIGTQNKQFNAEQLAGLQANPYSAAELAFRRSGQGLSPFSTGQTNAADIRSIIASPTSTGEPGGNVADFGGGQSFNIPDTLSGGQLSDLQGMPGSQGVLESIARAGGNPDIIARSLKALLPSMFSGTGTGLA